MQALTWLGEPTGQGWGQIGELGLALLLSAVIGLEQEIRGKSAGLRTHTLIGFAAALIMLVSKYGFTDVLGDHVTLDPSRVAAQIVSGIGFIGGGLIFVRRDAVRGLTTAASVWLTTAVGMAAGAGLPVLAVLTTAAFFLVVYGFTSIIRRLPSSRQRRRHLQITYVDGRGLLRQILEICTRGGWTVAELSTRQPGVDSAAVELGRNAGRDQPSEDAEEAGAARALVSVLLGLQGPGPTERLISDLAEVQGVVAVATHDVTDPDYSD